MTKTGIFYVEEFKVDLSRSAIIKGEQQTQVEPKVLKVLLLLAERQNEVVTHQDIMDNVWQGTEVVPNALQRCIAILRKAFNDNAKSPSFIATQPRIGYRLIAEVKWPSQIDSANDVDSPHSHTPAESPSNPIEKSKKKSAFLFAAALVFFIFLAISLFQSTGLPEHYSKIQQITQTDAHESHAIFSPDSAYLVFNRYAGSCKNHIWARSLSTGAESRLTQQPGSFGAMSFTGDGRELVFAAQQHCDKTRDAQRIQVDNEYCWNIATLDFALALAAPTTPKLRHQCQAERLENPKPLSNHQYAFLQLSQGDNQLIHYDDLSKELSVLYSPESLYIYHFDYDPEHKRFAVLSRDKDFNNLLQILDSQGMLISSSKLQLVEGMSRNQFIPANFEPQGQYLIAISNKQLLKIDLDGQMQAVKTPNDDLLSVFKHPQNNSLLAVAGKKDIDIARVQLNRISESKTGSELNSQVLPFASLTRSKAQERHPQFQPKGEQVAFISDRSGGDQLWLWHNDQATQLSFFPPNTILQSFSWSPDGQKLAAVSDDKLSIIDLESNVQRIATKKPLFSVLSWYAKDQFIVLINDLKPNGLYRLDTSSNTLTPFGINNVEAAWVHQQQLIYSNTQGDVYTRSLLNEQTKPTHLNGLNGQALFLDKDTIYSVNQNDLMLNQYDLQGQFIRSVMPLKPFAWKVSGLKDDHLLLSQFIAINNEIVILH